MDMFKKKFSREAMDLDFYDPLVSNKNKTRANTKKKLHRLSRARVKREFQKEIELALEEI